jgi:hypothetical protein
MHQKLVLCLVLFAALIAGFLLFQGGERRGASPPPLATNSVRAQPNEPVAVEAVAASSGAPSPAREASATPLERPSATPRHELAGLTGRVVESDGRAVPGLRVSLLEFDGEILFELTAPESRPSLELEETVTDPNGRFVLAGARAENFHGLGLDLGGPRATLRVLDHALVHGTRTDIGDVVLAPYGVLSGRVVDATGAPVAGARVRVAALPSEILQAHPYEFRTDSLISVNLAMMGEKGLWVIELPSWIRAELEHLPVPTTFTAADGSFRLEGVPLGKLIGGIDKPAFVGLPLGPLDLTDGFEELGTLALSRGRTVRGSAETAEGDPVANLEVFAGAELVPGVAAILQPAGMTDEDGAFELSGVGESGQVVVAARRSPHEPWFTTTTANAQNVLLEVEGTVELTALVRDDSGAPLAHAEVRLEPRLANDPRMGFAEALAFLPRKRSPRGTFTEIEPGRYVARALSAGHYTVHAEAPGRAAGLAKATCLAGSSEVIVVCGAGQTCAIQVLDAATKEALARAEVSALDAGRTGFAKLGAGTTDEGGHVVLGPLARPARPERDSEALSMLRVRHPRYAEYSGAFDPSVAKHTIELVSGATLAGRVHWGGAVPTRLYMLTLEARDVDGFLGIFRLPRLCATNLAGEFRCANLAPGKYQVSLVERFLQQDPLGLLGEQFEPVTLYRTEMELAAGETAQLDIDLTPTGRGATARVRGHVRFEGRDLPGAEVTAHSNERVRTTTDSAGRFETPEFSLRDDTLLAIEGEVALAGGERRHLQLHSENLKLKPDELHTLELDLYPLRVPVCVRTAGSAAPVPHAQVSAQMQSEGRGRVTESTATDAAGEVELIVLEPGTYSVSASADGLCTASATVEVSNEKASARVTLELPRAVVCKGHVVDTAPLGNAAPWSYVWVHNTTGPNSDGSRVDPTDLSFELTGLPAGEYTATIYMNGRVGDEVTFVLGPEGNDQLVLEFTPRQEDGNDYEEED